MTEVFRTNVQETEQSDRLIAVLLRYFPDGRVTFDLEDRDKVLKVEGDGIDSERLASIVRKHGFECERLE